MKKYTTVLAFLALATTAAVLWFTTTRRRVVLASNGVGGSTALVTGKRLPFTDTAERSSQSPQASALASLENRTTSKAAFRDATVMASYGVLDENAILGAALGLVDHAVARPLIESFTPAGTRQVSLENQEQDCERLLFCIKRSKDPTQTNELAFVLELPVQDPPLEVEGVKRFGADVEFSVSTDKDGQLLATTILTNMRVLALGEEVNKARTSDVLVEGIAYHHDLRNAGLTKELASGWRNGKEDVWPMSIDRVPASDQEILEKWIRLTSLMYRCLAEVQK